jgi:hypothetical protein
MGTVNKPRKYGTFALDVAGPYSCLVYESDGCFRSLQAGQPESRSQCRGGPSTNERKLPQLIGLWCTYACSQRPDPDIQGQCPGPAGRSRASLQRICAQEYATAADHAVDMNGGRGGSTGVPVGGGGNMD